MTNEIPEISENDQKLAHILFDHLIYEVYSGLLTAYKEAAMMKAEDDRYEQLHADLERVLDELDQIINSALDTIPGLPSQEEAEEFVREVLDQAALLQGLPVGSLTPDKETLH